MRLVAAAMFEQDIKPVQVAHELRVSTKSAYQWRRRWRAGGTVALASKGPGGAVCRLGPAQLSRLCGALDQGPAAWGWAEDQRWTLERVTTLIGRLFHVRYTRCAVPRICCTGSGTPRRSQCTGPPNATSRRSRPGGT
jgi:putative transposase